MSSRKARIKGQASSFQYFVPRKMKYVCILLLLILAVVWAYPNSGEVEGSRRLIQARSERRTGDPTRSYNAENQMTKNVRNKRGIFSAILRTVSQIAKEAIKNVPRAVSPLSKIASITGKAIPYVELGITIVQMISDCPTNNICHLKETLQQRQEAVRSKADELDQTHSAVNDLIHESSRIQHQTNIIIRHFEHINGLFDSITAIKELENAYSACAKTNDTSQCLDMDIRPIEYVYQRMVNELNTMKRSNLEQAIISYVIGKIVEEAFHQVGDIVMSSKSNYDLEVKQNGKVNGISKKKAVIGKAIKGTFVKKLISVRNGIMSPKQTVHHKLKKIGNRFKSVKHRMVNLVHKRKGNTHRFKNINARKFSVRSFLGRLGSGALSGIASGISIYLQQKQYSKVENEMRLAIQKYINDTQELDRKIAMTKELQTNYTSSINGLVNQFRLLTENIVTTLDIFNDIIEYRRDLEEANLTTTENKIALYRNLSAALLSDTDRVNIQVKQDQLLRILKDDLFNFTAMKSWVDTENKVFEAVEDGIESNKTISYMCDVLDFQTSFTDRRVHWPILDVLCNLAIFHPHHREYDYYNMTEIRDYCTEPEGNFPLDAVLMQRKNTMIQETIERTVERDGKEDLARLSDKILSSLKEDSYMKSLGDFPDEKEVLCTIAKMFPLKVEYGFYVLSDFRPRLSCDLLTTRRFKQIKSEAMDRRHEKARINILLGPEFFRKYLEKKVMKHLQYGDPISSICENIRVDLDMDAVRREKTWPIKELLCALGSVAPSEMDVYDHYPVDVIRDQCMSGGLNSLQLQDILIQRKERLLEVNVRYHVDMEGEENPETMVKDFANLLMSDPIMEALDIIPTEHEMLCIIADLYPGKAEYGMYKLSQFRPMERCEQINDEEFKIMKEDQKRRNFEIMLYKYCSESGEQCFPISRQGTDAETPLSHQGTEPKSQALQQPSPSGTSSVHATRDVIIFITLFALQSML